MSLKDSMIDGEVVARKKYEDFADALFAEKGLTNSVWYEERGPSGTFWWRDYQGQWIGRSRKDFEEYLKSRDLLPSPKGKGVSDADKEKQSQIAVAVQHTHTKYKVQYAGPIAGMKAGVRENNGQTILVTRGPRIPVPVQGDFPTITALIDQMFGPQPGDSGPDQRPYFLGWWKHALDCLIEERFDHRGICMVLAGEAGCGKTLLKDLISLSLGGRECKPYRFMIGQENFNGGFIGSELWVVDDEQAQTDHYSRSELGANIKKTVADRLYRIRGMMREEVVLSMYRRLIICVNREPERLMVLPQLEDDIADKISILLAHKHPMPMPVGSSAEKTAFWNTLESELPHFIWHMLNEYKIEPPLYGRFGCTHFHHPTLCSDLFQMSRERTLFDQISRVLFPRTDTITWYWAGTASELRAALVNEDGPLTKREVNDIPSSVWLGKSLRKISKEHPDRCVNKKAAGDNLWFLTCEGRDVLDAVEFVRSRGDRKDNYEEGYL